MKLVFGGCFCFFTEREGDVVQRERMVGRELDGDLPPLVSFFFFFFPDGEDASIFPNVFCSCSGTGITDRA